MPARCVALCVLCLLMSAAAAAPQPAAPTDPVVATALTIHGRVLTLDSHVDIPGATYATPALDPGAATTPLKCDLTKMEKGGVDGAVLAVFVGQGPLDDGGYARAWGQALAKFAALRRLTGDMHPARSAFAASPADVERVVASRRRAIMTGVENGYPVGTDLANVRRLFDLGARYITLTHSAHNQIADSSGPREPQHNGLSPFGRLVVAEMNRLGMMVDVSHVSEKSFWDIVALSKAPIIASHSGSRAITDHDRNLTDAQLKALARNGGVIQVVALASYIKEDSPERREAIARLREEVGLSAPGRAGAGRPSQATMTPEERAAWQARLDQYRERLTDIDARFPGATLKDFVDHIDHVVRVAGVDHVGIGTDFDGGGGVPGFNDAADAPNVTIELVRRGYTEEQIGKIWGGNLMRVWREVERIASAASAGR